MPTPYFEQALGRFEEHVREFDSKYLSKGEIPKDYGFRPYRFCVRDAVLGLAVVKYGRREDLLVVDVCLTADPPQFPPHSGTKIVMISLLCEAFKCGAKLEIKFTENVEGGRVPFAVYKLARHLGVTLSHIDEGHISPAEARQLFMVFISFSAASSQKLMQLAVEEKVSPERVCFMVHNGVWELPEMESILLGSGQPERIILGTSLPEVRALYLNDLLFARAALLGSFLDRKLARRERGDEEQVLELEGDARRFGISFDPAFYAKIYSAEEPLLVPWIEEDESWVPAGGRIVAMVRARTVADIELHFEDDLATAAKMMESYGRQKENFFYLLYPRDFRDLPQDVKESITESLRGIGVGPMICPEMAEKLDVDAAKRLEKARVIRR